MTGAADIGHYPLLMVDAGKGQVFPFSSRGFRSITGPPARTMARNASSLFLGPDGQVRTITDIALINPNPFNRAKVFFGFAAAARVALEDTEVPTLAFTTFLLDALARHRAAFGARQGDWWLVVDDPAEVQAKINAAPDLRHLYETLRFPPLEDCLDLL